MIRLIVVIGAERNQEFLLEHLKAHELHSLDIQALNRAHKVKQLQEFLAALYRIIQIVPSQIQLLNSVVAPLYLARQARSHNLVGTINTGLILPIRDQYHVLNQCQNRLGRQSRILQVNDSETPLVSQRLFEEGLGHFI